MLAALFPLASTLGSSSMIPLLKHFHRLDHCLLFEAHVLKLKLNFL
jgi:hypothetical protein